MSVVLTDVLVWQPAIEGAIGPVDVRIEGNRIAEVAAGARTRAAAGARVFAGNGHHLVVPGLVNAHFHSPANHLGGSLPSLPLEMFMLYESPAADELRPTPREAYLRTLLGAIEMLQRRDDGGAGRRLPHAGTGCRDDRRGDGRVPGRGHPRECGPRPARAARDRQAAVPGGARDRAPPDVAAAFRRPGPMAADELLEHYRHLFATWHGAAGGRLTAAVSVSAPQRVSPDYFAALDALSAEHDVPLFAHMLETRAQRALATRHPRFGGRSLVRYTADLGLLTTRTNVIHAVWVDEQDLDLLAASGATVLHNPVSNLRLGSGVMPWRPMRERGIPIGLGVDEAICNDAVDMWSVVRATGLVHNVTDPDPDRWPRAAEVLDCLWRGGASALLRADDLGLGRGGQAGRPGGAGPARRGVRDALRPRRAARVPGGRAGRRPHHGGRADRRRGREAARRGRGRRARRVAGDLTGRNARRSSARTRTPAAPALYREVVARRGRHDVGMMRRVGP